MHGVDAYSLLSSLPLLTSHWAQDFYRGWAEEGAPPPDNIVPVQGHPENRFNYGWKQVQCEGCSNILH